MPDYSIVGLYDHNIKSYEKIKKGFEEEDRVAIIQATGSGKSYNAIQLAYDNKDKKILYVVPNNSIIEHIKEIINSNPNLDLERDFNNITFITYQGLLALTDEEIEKMEVNYVVLDEFHHIGAPKWGAKVHKLIDTHNNVKVLGMSAYSIRGRGTGYERDMIDPDGDELFSNKVVNNYDLADAIIDGILPKPIYRSAYLNLNETIKKIQDRLKKNPERANKNSLLFKILSDAKQIKNGIPNEKDVFLSNISKNGKYIYFCPVGIENSNSIVDLMKETKSWLYEKGLTDDDFEFYVSTSKMDKKEAKNNRDAFYKNISLDNKNVSNKLRIMFAINQYNEGVHVPDINGVIMGRNTGSDIVCFEQFGRALATSSDVNKRKEELKQLSIEQLINICKDKKITLTNKESKEELIDIIVSPIIIDLANNIDFILELEAKLDDKKNEKLVKGENIEIINTKINYDMLNKDSYELVKYVQDNISFTWDDYYDLAKAYFEEKNNLYIPKDFRTVNGYDYDENGIKLGEWFYRQLLNYDKYVENHELEKINKLEDIYVDWNTKNYSYFNSFFNQKLKACKILGKNINDIPDNDFSIFDEVEGESFPFAEFEYYTSQKLINEHYDDEKFEDDFVNQDNLNRPEDIILNEEAKKAINDVLDTLTEREKRVIELRFGLKDGEPKKLEEIAKEFNVNKNIIRQIESKALIKLRHPARKNILTDFIDNYDDSINEKNELDLLSELIYSKSSSDKEKIIYILCNKYYNISQYELLDVVKRNTIHYHEHNYPDINKIYKVLEENYKNTNYSDNNLYKDRKKGF